MFGGGVTVAIVGALAVLIILPILVAVLAILIVVVLIFAVVLSASASGVMPSGAVSGAVGGVQCRLNLPVILHPHALAVLTRLLVGPLAPVLRHVLAVATGFAVL